MTAADCRSFPWRTMSAEGMVRCFRERPSALHGRDRAGRALDRPGAHLQHSCYGCHVSQLRSNYDVGTDSYRTTWAEPGINCETCHGPGEEHIRVASEAGPASFGKVPLDLELIVTKGFTHDQKNEMCAPCHAGCHPLRTISAPEIATSTRSI